eukprot:scaffold21249_cov32-Tisochrysis_lutea.AAC.5
MRRAQQREPPRAGGKTRPIGPGYLGAACRALGNGALLVEECQDAALVGVEELQLGRIVGEGDVGASDAFALPLGLLPTDECVRKVGLQPLVSEIDAELLKAIGAEVFEAKDVKEADRAASARLDFGRTERLVEAGNDTVE